MNEMIKRDCVTDVIKNTDVKISLEGWPCTVATIGICVTVAIVEWLKYNQPVRKIEKETINLERNAA